MNPKEVLSELGFDRYEGRYGAVGVHFDVCGILTDYAPPYPASHWQYRPSPLGHETDTFAYETMAYLLDNGHCTEHDIYDLGELLHRYVRFCDYVSPE